VRMNNELFPHVPWAIRLKYWDICESALAGQDGNGNLPFVPYLAIKRHSESNILLELLYGGGFVAPTNQKN